MANPRIYNIIQEIESLIDSMTIVGGYNYDWPRPSDYTDRARYSTFPASFVRYKSERIAESNIAVLYGFQNAEILIEIEYKITPGTSVNPKFTADLYLDKALADLRKLFRQSDASGYLPLSGEAVMSFVSSEKEDIERNDSHRPVKLITTWDVFYHNS